MVTVFNLLFVRAKHIDFQIGDNLCVDEMPIVYPIIAAKVGYIGIVIICQNPDLINGIAAYFNNGL